MGGCLSGPNSIKKIKNARLNRYETWKDSDNETNIKKLTRKIIQYMSKVILEYLQAIGFTKKLININMRFKGSNQ